MNRIPKIIEPIPIARLATIYCHGGLTQWTADPPTYINIICTPNVNISIMMNIGLLKKSLKMLNSLSFIFLQLISLNTYINTKVSNRNEYTLPF